MAEAVARYYFKLMAYKDEYEVARLYTQTADSRQSIKAQFEGDYKLHFHLAPPLLAKRDPVTGELQKAEYGPWIFMRSSCWPSCAACAAARSISSGIRTSVAWSAS